MIISFVLPGSGRRPSGGFRIVYEHANRLASRGHTVRLVHAASFQPTSHVLFDRKVVARYLRDRFTAGSHRRRWFRLLPEVRVINALSPSVKTVGIGDAVIATSWQTAFFVSSLPPSAGEKFYFLQSYEDWDGPPRLVQETWRMPLRKIVIAKWLEDLARELNEDCDFVINAIDHEFFALETPLENRVGNHVLFQSMARPLKGSADAISAINLLRSRGVDLSVSCFGNVDPCHFGLRGSYDFTFNPPQEKLRDMYNAASIYLSPSHIEGWGLTIAEAAACGAALLVSDIGGHRELARPGLNALTFPPRDIECIASQLSRLISDPELRQALARQAAVDVRRFDWGTASAQFEAVLKEMGAQRE